MVHFGHVRNRSIRIFVQVVHWIRIFQFISMDKQGSGGKVLIVTGVLFIGAILLLVIIMIFGA
jgi:hypothetical protein